MLLTRAAPHLCLLTFRMPFMAGAEALWHRLAAPVRLGGAVLLSLAAFAAGSICDLPIPSPQ